MDRQAVQVHHLTYDHFKHEFLFELSSICYECHCREHGIVGFESKRDGTTAILEIGGDEDEEDAFIDPTAGPIPITDMFKAPKFLIADLEKDSPIEIFRKKFWEAEYLYGSSIPRRVMSVFACDCKRKEFGFIQREKRKEYFLQCSRCGDLSKSSLAKNPSKEKPIELDPYVDVKFVQAIVDGLSARRRTLSWEESVAQGIFWPCDCKEVEPCLKENEDGTWEIGDQCVRCGGFVVTEELTAPLFDRFPSYNEDLAWKYRFHEIYFANAELASLARQAAEKRLKKQLELESSQLKLAEVRWRRLKEQRECEGFDAIVSRVLVRDNFVCQACLLTQAKKVFQYQNYSRIPFDCTSLISICDGCLDRIDRSAADK